MGVPDENSTNTTNASDEKGIAPRDNLINTAVTFLSDKKIIDQDPSLLKRFLLKKGLTEEEATIAFQRLEPIKKQHNLVTEYGQPAQTLSGHFVPTTYPLPLPPPVPSMWHTVHNIITTITSVAGIFYAIYWLWKTYISPYLFGRKSKKSVETSLAELETAIGSCADEIKTIATSVDNLVGQKAAEISSTVVASRIQEVKTEISSLKALLLNRSQFPATPAPLSTTPISIPAWQLSADDTTHQDVGEHEEEGSGSNGGTTNGSESSLEIVKDPNQ